MREILFRGKRKDNGKFVYGFLVMNKCLSSENGRLIYYTRPEIIPIGEIGEADYDGDGNYYEYVVIPETVGQYTGLTDKNGKKIFEGDILEITSEYYSRKEKYLYQVRYHEATASWCAFAIVFLQRVPLCRNECKYYEIIGNIHDNPELLKGSASDA